MIIDVKFAETAKHFSVQFTETSKNLGANFGEVQTVTKYVGGERYEGEYDITPKVEAQTLPTANKVLERDVTIDRIPYAEVQNNSNGTTVTIA